MAKLPIALAGSLLASSALACGARTSLDLSGGSGAGLDGGIIRQEPPCTPIGFDDASEDAYVVTRTCYSTECGEPASATLYPVRLGYPVSLLLGRDGNIWFSDDTGLDESILGRMSLDGGMALFQLSQEWICSRAITIGPDGNIWCYGANNEVEQTLTNALASVSLDGEATLLAVPDAGAGAVTVPLSNPQFYPPGGINGGYGMASPGDGTVWMNASYTNGGGTLFRLREDGTATFFPLADISISGGDPNYFGGGPGTISVAPTDLAVGSNGEIAYAGASSDFRYAVAGFVGAEGVTLEVALPDDFGNVSPVTVDDSGNLWVGGTLGTGGNAETIALARVARDASVTEFPYQPNFTFPALGSGAAPVTSIGIGPNGDIWFQPIVWNPTTLFTGSRDGGTALSRLDSRGRFTVYPNLPQIISYSSGDHALLAGPDGALWIAAGYSNPFAGHGDSYIGAIARITFNPACP